MDALAVAAFVVRASRRGPRSASVGLGRLLKIAENFLAGITGKPTHTGIQWAAASPL